MNNSAYNSEVVREIFEDSLNNLGLSLLQAKDWINSRLEGLEYSYEQLYRLRNVGLNKPYARRTLNKEMLRNLAQIGFWWNKTEERAYTQEELEAKIYGIPNDYSSQSQLTLLELAEVEQLKERVRRLSPVGRAALLIDEPKDVTFATTTILNNATATVASFNDQDFYRFRNWLTESLNLLGRPGQPRTAAQENGYRGRIGENLNLVFEGDRQANLMKEDYLAASYILFKIEGWNGFQPIFSSSRTNYRGDWQKMLIDLGRSKNGHPTSR